jgi:hypothetical protein
LLCSLLKPYYLGLCVSRRTYRQDHETLFYFVILIKYHHHKGQAEDIRVEASQIMRIRNNLVKMYSLMTGQTTEQIVLDLDR